MSNNSTRNVYYYNVYNNSTRNVYSALLRCTALQTSKLQSRREEIVMLVWEHA